MSRVAAVIGAGPVGCLAALALANHGWQVQLYDARSETEMKEQSAASGRRSINLAISARGIAAMEAIDPAMASRILETMIPMRGRYIHRIHGSVSKQPYDPTGQCINSVDRGILNRTLLQEALVRPNIQIFFRHKLVIADFDNKTLSFQATRTDVGGPIPSSNSTEEITKQFDFCVGADGSYSNVRRQLMRVVRMDFQQQYIPHDYLELEIPPMLDEYGSKSFALDPNYLHIWPRYSFMLIALPNKDKSFTCTIFAPTEVLERLSNRNSVSAWLRVHFPDLLALVGEEKLLNDFLSNPKSSLISIKAKPYHYKDRVIILGDAAHSMVPFYGQGLNCGFEDVRVLGNLLRLYHVDAHQAPEGGDDRLAAALETYSNTRCHDLAAINDLAMENYVEMRHLVATPLFLVRKIVDNILSVFTPHRAKRSLSTEVFPAKWAGGWLPLYTMVTFRSDMSYWTAYRQAYWQDTVVRTMIYMGTLCGVGIGLRELFWRRG